MMNLREFMATFPDENACREYLMMRRWPNGPVCPRCNKREFVYNINLPVEVGVFEQRMSQGQRLSFLADGWDHFREH